MARTYHWPTDSKVLCPYYQGEDEDSVRCEGVCGARVMIMQFGGKAAKWAHTRGVCETNGWKRCPIARVVGEKYEETGSH